MPLGVSVLYPVFRARTTSAYIALHAIKITPVSSLPIVFPSFPCMAIHSLPGCAPGSCSMSSPSFVASLSTFFQYPYLITLHVTMCSWFSAPLHPWALHVLDPHPPADAIHRFLRCIFIPDTRSRGAVHWPDLPRLHPLVLCRAYLRVPHLKNMHEPPCGECLV